ncbi:hypothetical protein FKM82_007834 [Ascaphus truei]
MDSKCSEWRSRDRYQPAPRLNYKVGTKGAQCVFNSDTIKQFYGISSQLGGYSVLRQSLTQGMREPAFQMGEAQSKQRKHDGLQIREGFLCLWL